MLGLSNKNDVANLIRQADEARDARRWVDARTSYREALDLDPQLPHIWIQYGHSLKESGELAAAEAAYREGIRLAPTNPDSHLQLGHSLKLQRRSRAAGEAYVEALKLDPNCADARAELVRMGWSAAEVRKKVNVGGALSAGQVMVALELSDLVDFLQGARYPTGIQRVQMCLAESMSEDCSEQQLCFVYFDHTDYVWREIGREQIADIIDLIRNTGRSIDSFRDEADRIKSLILSGPPFELPHGCFLVNPGTSWGYWNYFLAIRDAKRRFQIRYVPLVHDCIPVLLPEFCNAELVKDYLNWLVHTFSHADMVLSNSENTKRDFLDVARKLQIGAPPVETVTLNGEFGSPETGTRHAGTSGEVLHRHNLDVDDFVLFVSTIEPRKNHSLALSAWSRMIKSGSLARVPRLVCVGNPGWMNDAFYGRLERDPALRERVLVLNSVSDQSLKTLYDKCLFTLFPSLYEGWGLPISEALAHGKIPLVSRIASHPEAGGELAVYFDVHSEADFYEKLVSLIQDKAGRKERERKIANATPLRPWREIGQQIQKVISKLPKSAASTHSAETLPTIALGRYYTFGRSRACALTETVFSGDEFRLGMDWHSPEPWGCWVKNDVADIGFQLPSIGGDAINVYLRLGAPAHIDNAVQISVMGSEWSHSLQLKQREMRWVSVPILLSRKGESRVVLRLRGEHTDDFAKATDGVDKRRSSLGVIGLYVCETKSMVDRLNIQELMAGLGTEHVSRRFNAVAKL